LYVTLLALCLFLGTMWWLYFSNKFTVEPNNRERLVLENAVTGGMDVLGPGVWFRMPWWKEFVRVTLNREPKKVTEEEVRTADGALVVVDYRYDMISGRRYNRDTGELENKNPDDPTSVDDEVVKQAVTRINFSQRGDRISQEISAALEEQLGHYTANELTSPATAKPPVPAKTGTPVDNAADLYNLLEKEVEKGANLKLAFVGINICGFQLTGIKAKSAGLQSDIEKKARSKKIAEGVGELLTASKINDPKNPLSYREAVATGDPNFATVALAEAARYAAKELAEGLKEGLKNIGKGAPAEIPTPTSVPPTTGDKS